MANTYSQINIHVVFSVFKKENFLFSQFRPDLFKYMSAVVNNLGQYSLAVNGVQDHVHLFFELNPSERISDVVKAVKSNSSRWINEKQFIPGKFSWQEGYGGFSYSRSQRNDVIQYIMNQEEHHRRRSFREEYLDLLQKFEIDFNSDYLFDFYD
jgi:REP element-mobilizing transposase RayT